MSKVIQWETREMPAMRVVGKALLPLLKDVQGPNNPLPKLWEQCFSDGTIAALDQLKDVSIDDAYVGWMAEWDENNQQFLYIVGKLMEPGTRVPDGFEYRDVAPCTVAVSWVQGPETSIFSQAHHLAEAAMKERGYVYDSSAGGWSMELYNGPRFTQPDAEGRGSCHSGLLSSLHEGIDIEKAPSTHGQAMRRITAPMAFCLHSFAGGQTAAEFSFELTANRLAAAVLESYRWQLPQTYMLPPK